MTKQLVDPKQGLQIGDDAELWRYISLITLFYYLRGNIFVPTVATLQKRAPFEGTVLPNLEQFRRAIEMECTSTERDDLYQWLEETQFTQRERDSVANHSDQRRLDSLRHRYFFTYLAQSRFAWCWFESKIESAAMWNTYGRNRVAIKSTVGRVREALEKMSMKWEGKKMLYRDLTTSKLRCTQENLRPRSSGLGGRPHMPVPPHPRPAAQIRNPANHQPTASKR